MKARKEKSHIKVERFSDRNISPLEQHPRTGKTLKNPFSRIPSMTPRSWVNECIPNVLWACVLVSALERTECLKLFRSVIINAREHVKDYKDTFISHNHLSRLATEDFDVMFQGVFASKPATAALSALLLVDCLPDRRHWERHLTVPEAQHWQILARAVADTFDHQSQEATDVRWLKLMHMVIMGRVHFSPEQAEFVEELRLYPDKGDMRAVRPSVRAAEIAFRTFEFGEEPKMALPKIHSEEFWSEMHRKTQCLPEGQSRPRETPKKAARALLDIAQNLANHFHATVNHTGIDPRHDSSFGLVLYSIQLLTEASIMYNHSAALGRSVLRTIVDCLITLAYLVSKDDPALWLRHRDYGSGQAKLAFLNNLRAESVPKFIDLDRLERQANEDRWLEFSDIHLGSWSELNLRTMAEEANVKDIYDNYSDICSGYVHGNWAAIRDASFAMCWNPLHRFHRIPAPPNLAMPSIISDGCFLINRMLDELAKLYNGFDDRLSNNPCAEEDEPAGDPEEQA
jgi:Family of unknown function (DUF5677)